MHVCATLSSAGTRFRKISLKKVTESVHATYALYRPIQRTVTEVCTFIKVPNVMKRVSVGVLCEEVWFLQRVDVRLFP